MTLRERLLQLPAASTLRLLRLNVLARGSAHQDFRPFVQPDSSQWQRAKAAAAAGKRVLIATNIGGHFGLNQIDRLLAVALTVRGANVTSVLCDGVLPACQMCEHDLVPNVEAFSRKGPPAALCGYCAGPSRKRSHQIGLPVARLSEYLVAGDVSEAAAIANGVPIAQIKAFTLDGLPVGEHALAGALRYYARGDLDEEPLAEATTRRFLSAAILIVRVYRRLLAALKPDVVVAHHGIYVPQGIVMALARSMGIRVVAWNPTYRKHCFIFSHDDTYHHTLMHEDVKVWRDEPLDGKQRLAIERYLASRRDGTQDWIRYHLDPIALSKLKLSELGADPAKPMALALTNVFWDAQLHYPANAFENQQQWLLDTIGYFATRPDLQLIVRVHPAENLGSPSSRQRAADVVAKAYPRLPDNVVMIPPESAVSTYDLASNANVALVYATKAGLELAATGLPVIVAGEAWVRGKGICLDAASPAHYRELLSALPFASRSDEERRSLALAYAYHFFFRRMLPVELVTPVPGLRRFDVAVTGLEQLERGCSMGLDVICEGILEGTPFVMPRTYVPPEVA